MWSYKTCGTDLLPTPTYGDDYLLTLNTIIIIVVIDSVPIYNHFRNIDFGINS